MEELIAFFDGENMILVASGLYLIMSSFMLSAYTLLYTVIFRVVPNILGFTLLILALKHGGII